jgi:hypothetical protein
MATAFQNEGIEGFDEGQGGGGALNEDAVAFGDVGGMVHQNFGVFLNSFISHSE